ncbi:MULTISPECIES: hypothetical protein [unclassified Pseudomonas]|jgi:cytoskeletal protein RodZ|uniref:hypothetical protein n=1 Tax=unclassified Pseudomonas TaxID=196821 RepID=UPI001039A089|nr:hypothetical protein [Pseudomonas sp. B14(2022)]NJJ60177.1 hypothetical protein [Pseudomonas sp. B14(2022)]
MEEFSFNALTALLWANKLITGLVISTLLAAILIQAYWDKVGYFIMRVWHGVPLIGKVARLSKQSLMLDAYGWPKSESELCDAYYSRYEKIGAKNVDFFNKSESYLRTIGERGRRERPFWVFALIFMLIMFEAVGFAYVLVPFINQNLSANDQSWMGWLFAFLLAVASAILAEVTGRAAHKNALISKARHWWENDAESDRPNQLKELPGIGIKHTDSDKDGKDYNRILARINTNHTVTPSHGWMVTTGIWIAIIAVAAFGIRTMQLKSIETEMVGSPHAFAQQNYDSASPFELPADSAELNDQADKQTLTDKMDAIRKASLITFIVLSVIYIAIQITSIWLASIFGFAGVESKTAWEHTHKFSSGEALENWMQSQRVEIASHADHKLSKLQLKLAGRTTTNAQQQAALTSAHNRSFETFVARKQTLPATPEKPLVVPAAPVAAPIQPSAPLQAANPEPAVPSAGIDALRSKDLTAYSEEQLATISRAKGHALEDVLALRAEQQLLKDFDATGA